MRLFLFLRLRKPQWFFREQALLHLFSIRCPRPWNGVGSSRGRHHRVLVLVIWAQNYRTPASKTAKHKTPGLNHPLAAAGSMAMTRSPLSVPELHGVVSVGVVIFIVGFAVAVSRKRAPLRGRFLDSCTTFTSEHRTQRVQISV